MEKKFLFFQSIINYRVEVKEDSTIGNPEITSKFTKEAYAPKKKVIKEPKAPKPIQKDLVTESEIGFI